MLIDRAYAPVMTLGPKTRIAVWCVGCSKRCAACANPELWRADATKSIADERLASALVAMAHKGGISRITFTGGDPFEQPESLANVLARIRPHFEDILVYTGYELEELQAFANGELRRLEGMPQPEDEGAELRIRAATADALALVDVLIDGPYVESLNDGACAMRGSTNQRVHVFNEKLRPLYDQALCQPRRIQNVYMDGTCMSIGIHGAPKAQA